MKIQDWTKLFTAAALALALAACESPTTKTTGEGVAMEGDEGVTPTAEKDTMSVPEAERIHIDEKGVEWGRWEPIHFDYDSATIKAEDRPTLEAIAAWAKQNSAKKLMIAGHCDERGTLEYNRALGQRRASAAREYLVKLGASAKNVGTVSYGEERPVDPAHHDEAWAKNRRDEFGVAK